MHNFLLELLVEEIPANFQAKIVDEFKNIMLAEFEKAKIIYETPEAYITPRRIVFSANLNEQTEEYFEEKKGPQTSSQQNIIEKFMESNGISSNGCFEKNIDKKVFLFASIKHESKNTSNLLGEIIKKCISNISCPKSMCWGVHRFSFIRPIRNILSIYNGRLIDINFDEIDLRSSDFTFGHRFLSNYKIYPKNIEDYFKKTKEQHIIVDHHERKSSILSEIKKLESAYSISVDVTEQLLNEVVGLVEYPVVLIGKIPDKFMTLPEEVITTPLRKHQRYFSTSIGNRLSPFFIFIANIDAEDGGKMVTLGNERVLNARLEDALFFFETDLQNSLDSYLEKLKKIAVNEKLGTIFDRIKRISLICNYICKELHIDDSTIEDLNRIAILAKCDLSTSMVCEFTELQGIVGAYYANIQGESEIVCEAIRDQYKSADELISKTSAIYSFADKIEILTGFFAIGKEPTGSKDPFALRRAAITILKIIKKYDLSLDLKAAVQYTFNNLIIVDKKSDTVNNVVKFIMERLKILLKESGINHNVAASMTMEENDVLCIYKKAEILNQILQTEEGKKLSQGYRRAKNIIKSNTTMDVNQELFMESAENKLLLAIEVFENRLITIAQNKHYDICNKFREQLNAFLALESTVSDFFDSVLVNTENQQIRSNRLNLLTKLIFAFQSLKIESSLE